jgi:hypothetical protein
VPDHKLRSLDRAATVLKQLIPRADLNQDGAVRNGEIMELREHLFQAGKNSPGDVLTFVAGLQGAQSFARSRGGSSVEKLLEATDELLARVKAANKSPKDDTLDELEQRELTGAAERQFLNFATIIRGRSLADFPLPPQREPSKPKFNWSGTAAQVCQSLLEAHTNSGNDNFWPSWARQGAVRYVIDAAEAKEMADALRPLYVSRQKAVLQELARRSRTSEPGCVAPNAAAKNRLVARGDELGIALQFGNPAAPKLGGL